MIEGLYTFFADEKFLPENFDPAFDERTFYDPKLLWSVLNGFRLKPHTLVGFIDEVKRKRMIDEEINGHPPNTYACFDYWQLLNG